MRGSNTVCIHANANENIFHFRSMTESADVDDSVSTRVLFECDEAFVYKIPAKSWTAGGMRAATWGLANVRPIGSLLTQTVSSPEHDQVTRLGVDIFGWMFILRAATKSCIPRRNRNAPRPVHVCVHCSQ